MAKANFDVAYRVLHPKMPIAPGIVKVKTKLKSEMGKVFLANSITLTPGTFTIDLKDEFLYIHWIYVRYKDVDKATQNIVSLFEKYLIKIFD
jgi:multicomponent Na+:H+ antiporter subunit E